MLSAEILRRSHPDAGGAVVAEAFDVESREGVDDDLFEESQVADEAQVEAVEVEDGVDDQLAWAVVGNVAAAVGFCDLDAGSLKLSVGGDQVRACPRAAADGDDGRIVLDQEEGHRRMMALVAGGISRRDDLLLRLLLNGVGVGIRHAAEVADGELLMLESML